MEQQPGVARIYGLGESMGTGVLIQSLAYHSHFRAIVAECSFATFEEIAEYRVGRELSQVAAWPVVKIAQWYSRWRYGVNVMKASPIHGTADVNIPEEESRELHDVNPGATVLWEVKGATHVNAMSADPQEYRGRVLNWFAEH